MIIIITIIILKTNPNDQTTQTSLFIFGATDLIPSACYLIPPQTCLILNVGPGFTSTFLVAKKNIHRLDVLQPVISGGKLHHRLGYSPRKLL